MTRVLLALTAALLLAAFAGSQTAGTSSHEGNLEPPINYYHFKEWRLTWKQRTNRVRDNRCYKPLHFRARAWEVPARRRAWVLSEWSKKPDRNRARNSRCLPTTPRAALAFVLAENGWAGQYGDAAYIIGIETGHTWDPCIHYSMTHNCGYAGVAACGLPQARPCTKLLAWCNVSALGSCSAVGQLRWFAAYVRGRYGSPAGAQNHHAANGWY